MKYFDKYRMQNNIQFSEELERLMDIVTFILSKLPYNISKQHLACLLFIIDLKFLFIYKTTKRTFTNLTYFNQFSGPYSEELEYVLNELAELGYIEIVFQEKLIAFKPVYDYVLKLKTVPSFILLSSNEQNFIFMLVQDYLKYSTKELLDIVESTSIYEKTALGYRINLIK